MKSENSKKSFFDILKEKDIFPFVIVTMILIPLWVFEYMSIKSTAKYTIGITLDNKGTRGLKDSRRYYFYVGEKKYIGSITKLKRGELSPITPNERFLVVYSENNPEVSIILFDKPIKDTINLDSLNALGVAEDDIDWKKL